MEELQHHAERLLHTVRSYCGDTNDSEVDELKRRIERMISDFKTHKNPRDLENEANQLKEYVHHMHDHLMTPSHRQDMHHHFDEMRLAIRKFE